MKAAITQVSTAAYQRRRLWQGIGGGALAGILLWSFLPGTIARAVPEDWHWPERMAARMVGESSRWDAGTRLMRSESLQAWNALVQAADMLRDNREAIETLSENRRECETAGALHGQDSGREQASQLTAKQHTVRFPVPPRPTAARSVQIRMWERMWDQFSENCNLSCKNNNINCLTGDPYGNRTRVSAVKGAIQTQICGSLERTETAGSARLLRHSLLCRASLSPMVPQWILGIDWGSFEKAPKWHESSSTQTFEIGKSGRGLKCARSLIG
ncbi:MAG: hypothetical protein IPI83_11645 [Sphingomonadales bacterium]|nr:hypothetical protein [Sphingomonadales bacterium]